MLVYLGSAVLGSFRESYRTAPVVMTTLEDTAEASGVAVRQELVLSSARSYVFVSAQDGAALSRGSLVGSAMDSEAALERAGRARELTNEIRHVEAVLSGITEAEDLTEKDAAIRSGVLKLSAAMASNNLSELDSLSASISSLAFPGASATVSEADLAALKAELRALEREPHSDSEDIRAPQSGLFTTMLDGREFLTPEALEGLTVSGLSELMDAAAKTEAGALGKLITGMRWYYAGLISPADAEKLEKGDYVLVSFPRHGVKDLSMRVERISDVSGGKCALVLSTLRALADTVAMREADAVISISRQSGLRVPTRALHVDEEGRTYVYVITAMRVEIKYVEILADGGDYTLVAESTEAGGLREGNEVIVGGRSIHEGMVLE